MDYAAEWDSLPAQAPTAATTGPVVEIHGTSTSTAPPARDYGAEWDALPAGAPTAPTPPKSASASAPAPPTTSKPIDLSQDDLLREAGRGIAEVGTHLAKSTAATVAQGLGNIYDVVRGGSMMAPLSTGARMSDWVNSLGGAPQTYVGRYGNQALDFVGSLPMRLIGQPLGDLAERLGAPPALSALASSAGAVAGPAALGRLARGAVDVPRETSAPRVEPSSATEGPSSGVVAGPGSGGGAAGQPVSAGALEGGGNVVPANAGPRGGAAPSRVSSVPQDLAGIATPAERLPPTAQLSSPSKQFFPAVKKSTVGADLSAADQAERAQVLHAVGIDDAAAGFREGALTGNPKTQASEVMTSRAPGALGDVLQQQFADEQNALRSYAQGRRDMAGGTQSGPELPQEQAMEIRGRNIVSALDQLDQWYNKRASDMYSQANANATGPMQSSNLDALLKNSDFRQTLVAQNNRSLLDALDAQVDRFHTEGWGDQQGPNTVGAAEAFRKWLNQTGTPETGRIMAQVKEALDNDVAQAGGADTFKAARTMWRQYKQTLGDPKGISSLLQDDAGNRTVPFNQVSQRVATMGDLDQFRHIVTTLKGIRNMDGIDQATVDASNKALQEIRQQVAENAVNAGGTTESWNSRNFNKTVNANAYRMGQLFSPDELRTFRTLNDAGFILENQHAYPGAAVQGLTLAQSLGVKGGTALAGGLAGAVEGGFAGGALAGAAGSTVGNFLTNRMAVARALQMRRQMRSNVEKYFPTETPTVEIRGVTPP